MSSWWKQHSIFEHKDELNPEIGYQFSSVIQSCPTLCGPMDCSMPGLPVHHQLPEFTHTHIHWVSEAIQPLHPLSSPSPLTFNLSQHQSLFESVLRIRWPKYWSFSFSISPSNEYSGLISFRMDWLDLLAGYGDCQNFLWNEGPRVRVCQTHKKVGVPSKWDGPRQRTPYP